MVNAGRSRFLCLLAAIGCAVAGCSSSLIGRQAVFGTINGAEGRSGLVSFIPEDDGPATRVKFTDGTYSFDESNGPVPGEYRVVVQLEKQRPAGVQTVLVKGVPVPIDQASVLGAEYEKRSLQVSVPSEGSMQVDLKLPSQADPEPDTEHEVDSADAA
jgi:hypothetical protein